MKNGARKKRINFMNISAWVGFISIAVFLVYGYKEGIFSSTEAFRAFVEGFGTWEAFIFIIIQTISVIVPVLPTSIGCIASIVVFGPWLGFLYSYIGICLGSIIAFILSKKYGRWFVKGVVGSKIYTKYIGLVDNEKNFNKIFAFAIFLPGAPDDFLCYIAGLTKMQLKKFVLIILLGKPMSIAIYSLGLTTVIQLILSIAK